MGNTDSGIFALFGLLGGLSLFLFGMKLGSRGLQKAAGGKLRLVLSSLTRNRFVGLMVGVIVTIITQSSSATTVMLVSFADAGLLALTQTLGVILGADIGTTFTVQLIAFKIFDLAFLILTVGFLMSVGRRQGKRQDIGQIVIGFGLIFLGMKVMSEAVAPWADGGQASTFLASGRYSPWLGVLIGAVVSGLIHSGATIGLTISLAFQSIISLEAAIPLILGANIGTCTAALLASRGTSLEARRVAWAHTLFKICGVLLLLPFVEPFGQLIAETSSSLPRQVANAHALFNIAMALVFLPVLPFFGRLVGLLVKEGEPTGEVFGPRNLDEKVLDTPALALGQATREIVRMADRVYLMLDRTPEVLEKNDAKLRDSIIEEDDRVDLLYENITRYLTRISQEALGAEESARATSLLFVAVEIEHVGDIVSKALMAYATKKIDAGFRFSAEGSAEIRQFHERVLAQLQMAIDAFVTWDKKLAARINQSKPEIDALERKLHDSHIQRLQRGLPESLETSTVHLDLISDLRRVNFHTTNIARAVLGSMKPAGAGPVSDKKAKKGKKKAKG